jgi:hypothetical protein
MMTECHNFYRFGQEQNEVVVLDEVTSERLGPRHAVVGDNVKLVEQTQILPSFRYSPRLLGIIPLALHT